MRKGTMFSGVVLSAGFGTRLHPFTSRFPKPLVPILNRTPLWHQIMLLINSGLTDIYVNLHFMPDLVKSYLKRHFDFVKYTFEHNILGTGGGIKNVINHFKITKPVIVLNGDTISNVNLNKMMDFHIENNSDATMLLIRNNKIRFENSVFIDNSHRVRYIKERPENPNLVYKCKFLGVHILNPATFDYLPDSGCINKITYPTLIANNYKIYGYLTSKDSFDIGTPENLYKTNFMLKKGKYISSIFNDRYLKNLLDLNGNIIGENVQITNSDVSDSIIGDNSIICNSRIKSCIIFPDSKIMGKNLKRDVANTKYEYII